LSLHNSIKTQAASPQVFLFFGEMDYFMIPFGGVATYFDQNPGGFAAGFFVLWRAGLFHDPFWGGWLHTSIKTQAASPQAFLFSKLAEASFARSENKKPTIIRGL
jgi:hypothetical protein